MSRQHTHRPLGEAKPWTRFGWKLDYAIVIGAFVLFWAWLLFR